MRDRSRLIGLLAAALLVIAGAWILVFGIPGMVTEPVSGVQYRRIGGLAPGTAGFPDHEGYFRIRGIDRIAVSIGNARPFRVDVAHYRNISDQARQALIFLPDESTTTPIALDTDVSRLRWRAWLDASRFLRGSLPAKRLFMAWWDNAQRIDLLSGEKTWIDAPVEAAFGLGQRDFWRYVSGGFTQRSEPSIQLAGWLLSDAEESLQAIEKAVEPTTELYFLAGIDDLARLSEMHALSGKPVPFETCVFRADENIHRLISSVKRWAREKANGSYLVQDLAGSGVRAWRIATVEGEKTLLARLLPFTSSLARPLKTLDLVHRSDWSGYLSIFRRNSARAERLARQANTR
ncbi:MAG: hypothetical protein L0Y38_07320 [Methylococcaceae bacterium]|nr:hypothetical protein [Methylococcaceae bacterium]